MMDDTIDGVMAQDGDAENEEEVRACADLELLTGLTQWTDHQPGA